MAELTPNTKGVLLDFKYTKYLRGLAYKTNRYMMEWFGERWSHCANIVAVDFFLSTNIVEIAINVNNIRKITASTKDYSESTTSTPVSITKTTAEKTTRIPNHSMPNHNRLTANTMFIIVLLIFCFNRLLIKFLLLN